MNRRHLTQARALLLAGLATSIVAGAVLAVSAGDYRSARSRWRADAAALGSERYDAARSDAHYELGEASLGRARCAGQALGMGLLLTLTGLFGLAGRDRVDAARPRVSPARALAVVWLDTSLCVALLVLNLTCVPSGARLATALAGALVPWLMATLLTAPVAGGFTLAGLLLGTRLRNDAGERPPALRALATLALLPLTLVSAVPGLPAHLALLALGRHPGAHRVSVHLTLLGLHGIRWRRGQVAA